MNIIIGKNSKIVKSIAAHLTEFKLISHRELDEVNFDEFDTIFLFSWCHKSLKANQKILLKLPLKKTIFVSTLAVFALAVRPQYARYPRDKAQIEKEVIGGGGRVIRFGIVGDEQLKRQAGPVPFTSRGQILAALKNPACDPITNLYEVEIGPRKQTKVVALLATIIKWLLHSRPMRFWPYMRAPFDAFLKMIAATPYGYTADLFTLFADTVQVGFGALGSRYCATSTEKANLTVIVSPEPDQLLEDSGFKGTRIGKRKNGLSKFWHGARIVFRNGCYRKEVPLFIRRKPPPRGAISMNVTKIESVNGRFRLALDCDISGVVADCKRLILGAGALENCRLLSDMLGVPTHLSDQEVGCVGTISTEEAIEAGLVRKTFAICRRGKIFYDKAQGVCIDVRPRYGDYWPDIQLYNRAPSQIIKKIFQSLSLAAVNEAFFNKFGFGFTGRTMLVVAQVLSRDCVTIETGSCFRTRIDRHAIDALNAYLGSKYESFIGETEPLMVDAIHYQGGKSICDNSEYQRLLELGRLTVLGSPTGQALDALHNTWNQIDDLSAPTSKRAVL